MKVVSKIQLARSLFVFYGIIVLAFSCGHQQIRRFTQTDEPSKVRQSHDASNTCQSAPGEIRLQ